MPAGKASILAEPPRQTGITGNMAIPDTHGKGRIPGYQGYVPASQHVSGVTYGNMTRCTISAGFKVASSDVALPPSPNRTGGRVGRPGHHVPGYTGHVKGKMDKFASTYGQITRKCDPSGIVNDNGQLPDVQSGNTITESIGTNEPPRTNMTKDQAQAIYKSTTGGRIPGYGGFIRGGQHVAGSTFGQLTRSAKDEDFTGSYKAALPSSPHTNVSPRGNQPRHKLPGYTGFVPGKRDTFSTTYGETTSNLTGKTPISPSKTYISRTARSWDGVGGASKSAQVAAKAKDVDQCEAQQQRGQGRVPGYAGFVRGQQHHNATTFGQMTSSKANVFGDYEANTLLPAKHAHVQDQPTAHKIPGYTGHIQGTRECYAATYGQVTAAANGTQ